MDFLNEQFINDLPNTDEKIITKYQKFISNGIARMAKEIGIQKARQQANLKYGKGWRETLEFKKIFDCKNSHRMSYY